MPDSHELLDAVRRNDHGTVAALASDEADACTRAGQPWSCLAEAFLLGHRACALRLLEAVPRLSEASRRCVLRAMLDGPIDDPVLFLRMLDHGAQLQLGGADLPIEHACATLKHPYIVQSLFKRFKLKASVLDGAGWSPFLRAIHAGDTATARVFLDQGAQINARVRSADRRSALHLALDLHEPVPVLDWLLQHGVDPGLTDGAGRTAAQSAAQSGQHDLAQRINAHRPETLLWKGEESGRVVPSLVDREGWTPLLRAIHAGDTAMAQVFLDHGAHINARIEWADRRSALHLALEVVEEPSRVVEWLLVRGIDIGLVDDKGRTAVQLAKVLGKMDLADSIAQYRGVRGPRWHQDAVDQGMTQVICSFLGRADGLGFDPRDATHPFILGGDHDGFRRATPREALEHITWHSRVDAGRYPVPTAWPPVIERMLRGEDVRLAELVPLGKLVEDYSTYYQ